MGIVKCVSLQRNEAAWKGGLIGHFCTSTLDWDYGCVLKTLHQYFDCIVMSADKPYDY